MSPLLGSSGGSSEYAYRGTLDDWPNPFATALSAQNNLGALNPANSVTATLTITGLNYKARVIVDNDNATLSIDGGVTYVPARSTDASVFIRDNTTILIRLQPTSGSLSDFGKAYSIPVKIGKRKGTWEVSTRLIDETPNSFTFNGLINQQLGFTTISNTVTIVGFDTGFSFPISASANQTGEGTTINIYKNGSLIGVSGTVANNDQIYLSTQTPNLYATTRTFNVQVGTFTTTWGLITRNAVVGINPFSFVGVSSANILGVAYTSAYVTLSGADIGPKDPNPATWPADPTRLPVSISGPNAFFEIRTGEPGNPLRYTDPADPSALTYFQNGSVSATSNAFNGDLIRVKINSSSSYNTTVVGILTVSNQSASYTVTTRPTPIDTVPTAFTFTDLTSQGRGVVVTSSPITLSGMTNGASDFGTASIVLSGTTAGITPQFEVNNSGTWISSPTTVGVKSGDQIRLRMTTPNLAAANGVTNANLQFRVDGTDTTVNLPLEGYNTINAFNEDIWSIETAARSCPITNFIIPNQSNINLSTDVPIDFTVGGYNTDCQMNVVVNSDSSNYSFTLLNGATPPGTPPVRSLTNVAPGSNIRLSVRSSPNYITGVASTISVSNSASGVTPSVGFNTSFTITSVANTTTAVVNFSSSASSVEVGNALTLSWDTVNCTSFRSATITGITTPWGTSLPVGPGTQNLTVTALSPAANYTYNISFFVNPSANNVSSLGPNNGPIGSGIFWDGSQHYIQKSITIAVVNDVTPSFSPADFTDLSNQTESTTGIPVYVSSTIGISSITTSITGVVTSFSTEGVSGIARFDTSSGVTSKTFSSGDNVVVVLRTSVLFSSSSTAYVRFFNGATEVAGPITFNATTRACFPLTLDVTHTQTTSPSVTLRYYQDAQYLDSNTVPPSSVTDNLLYKETIGGVPVTGIIVTSTGGPGTLIDGTVLTWRQYINEIYSAFVTVKRRPPTELEVNTQVVGINIGGINSLTDLRTVLQSNATSSTSNAQPIGITTASNRCGSFSI